MARTEFCCRNGGNNLNAGSVDGGATEPATTPLVTYANGNWNSSTSTFIAASGANMTEAVVGRFCSICLDADTNPTNNQWMVARITSVTAGTRTIVVSASARSLFGTIVTTSTTGRTMRIGGAWSGPNAADPFPFNVITSAATNAVNQTPRVNMKNDKTYNISVGINRTLGGVQFQGYTSAFEDGGKWELNAGGNAIVIFTASSSVNNIDLMDMTVANNGTTNVTGIIVGSRSLNSRIVAHDIGGVGISAPGAIVTECEAYNCDLSNTAALGAISGTTGAVAVNCVAHHNPNAYGILCPAVFNCIAHANGIGIGTGPNANQDFIIMGCDAYANVSHGFQAINGSSGIFLINNNAFKNGGYGFNVNTASTMFMHNNAAGAGTMQNTSGAINPSTIGHIMGNGISYPANTHPWVDPDNGDFRVAHALAKGAGRGEFEQTQAGYAGATGFPDVGAVPSRFRASPTLALGA